MRPTFRFCEEVVSVTKTKTGGTLEVIFCLKRKKHIRMYVFHLDKSFFQT